MDPQQAYLLVRYDSDGKLDETFGWHGFTFIFFGRSAQGFTLSMDKENNLYLGGLAVTGNIGTVPSLQGVNLAVIKVLP